MELSLTSTVKYGGKLTKWRCNHTMEESLVHGKLVPIYKLTSLSQWGWAELHISNAEMLRTHTLRLCYHFANIQQMGKTVRDGLLPNKY